tara:strand:+ start:103 stop:486 length:384 start_codon:yes stop_codon:yes gene_type:complete
MAENVLEDFRFSLMEKVLPVGIAIVDRARKKGLEGVLDVFTSSDKPFEELQIEGDSAAQSLRDQLDKIKPGLGNPVIPVDIIVNKNDDLDLESEDLESLMNTLNNIEYRLTLLNQYIDDKSNQEKIL